MCTFLIQSFSNPLSWPHYKAVRSYSSPIYSQRTHCAYSALYNIYQTQQINPNKEELLTRSSFLGMACTAYDRPCKSTK